MIIEGKATERHSQMRDEFVALAKKYGCDSGMAVVFTGQEMCSIGYGVTQEKEDFVDALRDLVTETIDQAISHRFRQ